MQCTRLSQVINPLQNTGLMESDQCMASQSSKKAPKSTMVASSVQNRYVFCSPIHPMMLTLDETTLYYRSHILQILSLSDSNVTSLSKFGGLTSDWDQSLRVSAPHAQGGFPMSKNTNSTDITSSCTAHSLTQAPNTNVMIQQKPPLAPNPPHPQSRPHPCLQPCPPISTMTCMSITQIPTMVIKSKPIEDGFKDMSNHNLVIILDGDDS